MFRVREIATFLQGYFGRTGRTVVVNEVWERLEVFLQQRGFQSPPIQHLAVPAPLAPPAASSTGVLSTEPGQGQGVRESLGGSISVAGELSAGETSGRATPVHSLAPSVPVGGRGSPRVTAVVKAQGVTLPTATSSDTALHTQRRGLVSHALPTAAGGPPAPKKPYVQEVVQELQEKGRQMREKLTLAGKGASKGTGTMGPPAVQPPRSESLTVAEGALLPSLGVTPGVSAPTASTPTPREGEWRQGGPQRGREDSTQLPSGASGAAELSDLPELPSSPMVGESEMTVDIPEELRITGMELPCLGGGATMGSSAGRAEFIAISEEVLIQKEGDPGQFYPTDLDIAKKLLQGTTAPGSLTGAAAAATSEVEDSDGQGSLPGASIVERTRNCKITAVMRRHSRLSLPDTESEEEEESLAVIVSSISTRGQEAKRKSAQKQQAASAEEEPSTKQK